MHLQKSSGGGGGGGGAKQIAYPIYICFLTNCMGHLVKYEGYTENLDSIGIF